MHCIKLKCQNMLFYQASTVTVSSPHHAVHRPEKPLLIYVEKTCRPFAGIGPELCGRAPDLISLLRSYRLYLPCETLTQFFLHFFIIELGARTGRTNRQADAQDPLCGCNYYGRIATSALVSVLLPTACLRASLWPNHNTSIAARLYNEFRIITNHLVSSGCTCAAIMHHSSQLPSSSALGSCHMCDKIKLKQYLINQATIKQLILFL